MIAVARAGKLFGVDGGVLLHLYTAFPDDFSTEEPLFVKIDSLAVPLFCDRFERKGQAGARVRFADFDTERRALELLGKELFLERAADDENDEFLLDDLVGFDVRIKGEGAVTSQNRKQGELKGQVIDFYDSDANPLFEIEIGTSAGDAAAGGGRKVLVPAAEEFIAGIDFKKRILKLVLPEGLLAL